MSNPDNKKRLFSRQEVARFGIEAVLIVFSILLALGVNEWRASYKLNKQAHAALENIQKELENNRLSLLGVMDYHAEVSEKLTAYISNDSLQQTLRGKSLIEAMPLVMKQGLQAPRLQTAAWQAAQKTSISSRFNYETMYLLASTYELQQNGVSNTWKQIALSILNESALDPARLPIALALLQAQLKELHAQERYLHKIIVDVQSALSKKEKQR